MARVWAATDTVLNRAVAVKILHSHLRDDSAVAMRFRLEARNVARLDHHAVVTVYDTVTTEAVDAIVLEHVEGETLRERLDRDGRVSSAETARLAVELCGALDAAARVGVVHRDIKPANILLQTEVIGGEGTVKVADFGIAKTDQGDLTADDLTVGTASYVAPEQLLGLPVDGRSDQYALAVVLYECLAGHLPFTGDTAEARAEARLHRDPVPLSSAAPDVPDAMSDAIMTSLSREASHRFASSGQLGAALRDAARTNRPPQPAPRPTAPVTTGTTPPVPRRSTPRPAARNEGHPLAVGLFVAAILLVVAAVALLVIAAQTSDDQPRAQPAIDGQPATTDVGPLAIASVTPFDPQGTGPPGENDELAELTIDGDRESAWRTERYQVADFGLKTGVGLQVDLTDSQQLDRIEIDSPTDGWAAEVYVFERSAEVAAFDPDSAAAVATVSGVGGDARIPLDGVTGESVLIWVTDLGQGPEQYRFDVSEVRLLGSA